MIITVNDTQNSANLLYYQSLALLFLPCEKFTLNDTENKMNVDAFSKDGKFFVTVSLDISGKTAVSGQSEDIMPSKTRQMKNLIGRNVLSAFEKIFDRKPPWGISTGVKPVKLAREFILKDGEQSALETLCRDYAFDERKAKLCIEANRRETEALKNVPDNSCSVYISVPFCPSRCDYCSFVSCTTPRLLALIPDYIVRLKQDIADIADTVRQNGLEVRSVYVGGGTPAILEHGQINDVLDCFFKNFSDTDIKEFTFEAGRPDCITKPKLEVLKSYGIGRISVNAQTTNDAVLRYVGRNHTAKQFFDAFRLARETGFDCINTDLIAGLPSDSLESFKNSVDNITALEPENITVHAFTLKKSSKFRTEGNTDITSSFSQAEKMLDYAADKLGTNGYSPYYVYRQKNTVGDLDNTGYAKPGFESIYNIVMMGEKHTVFAAGAGAVTKLVPNAATGGKIERIFAPKYPYEYLDRQKYKGFDKQSVTQFYSNKK